MNTTLFETNAAVHAVRNQSARECAGLTSLAAILSASPTLAAAFKPNACERCFEDAPCLVDAGRAYCLPCLEVITDAQGKELALTPDSDVYEVAGAMDAAFDAASGCFEGERPGILRRFLANFPAYAGDLMDVGFARWAFGWSLTDPIEDDAQAA